MSATNNVIVAKGLEKSFKDLKVLQGLDLEVRRGTVLALLGPNGAGKTTTVRILSTLLAPDRGQVTVDGHDVVREPDAVRRVIGLTGQYAAVDEFLSGRENLLMMGRLYRLSKEDTRARATELLEQFDLTDAADRVVKTYSGGMRRRLDLAISLVAAPPIIFLDEPTTGLDPRSRLAMWAVIRQLVAGGATILLTTQYLEEADELADRIVVIDGGKVIAEGTADELKRQVGKDRLELMISKKSDLEAAKKALDGAMVRVDEKRRVLSVSVDNGVRQVKETLVQMENAGVEVESLSLHKPTLDDVFLRLTGHGADADKANDPEPVKEAR